MEFEKLLADFNTEVSYTDLTWGNLMPVFVAITKWKTVNLYVDVIILSNTASIGIRDRQSGEQYQWWFSQDHLDIKSDKDLINHVHIVVIQFIKWYNETQKS